MVGLQGDEDRLFHHEGYLFRKNIINRKFKNFFYLEEREYRLICAKRKSQLITDRTSVTASMKVLGDESKTNF